MKPLKPGAKVQWKWLGRTISGEVIEIYTKSVTKKIKEKSIKRNGTEENPAFLVKSQAGNLALKLQSELQPATSQKSSGPKMFKG